MSENSNSNTNISNIIELFKVTLLFITFFWGIYQWGDAKRRENYIRGFEAKKPYLELQLDTYIELIDVISILSVSKDKSQLIKAEKDFWMLYWGSLLLVDNSEIEKHLASFAEGLNQNNSQEIQRKRARKISIACGKHLNQSWDTEVWTENKFP